MHTYRLSFRLFGWTLFELRWSRHDETIVAK